MSLACGAVIRVALPSDGSVWRPEAQIPDARFGELTFGRGAFAAA